jgi:hypothetical protein
MRVIPSIIFAFLIVFEAPVGATDEEKDLAEALIEIIEPLQFTNLGKYIETPQPAIPEALEKIPDAEITRMIAAYVFSRDGENPFSDHVITRLLNAYPSLIQDDTEFRRMLMHEKDARRFHLLCSNLMSRVSGDKNADYIKEMAPMLMRDEPVGRAGGDYDSPAWHDVSIGTYNRILKQLRRAGAPFEEPDAGMRHEEKKLILARWLMDNWPGCENLEIPEISKNVNDPVDNTSMNTRERLRNAPATDLSPEVEQNGTLRYLLVGVAALLALAGAWFGLRRMKSGV